MSNFQQTIRQFLTTGFPGEFARTGPHRADPWNLDPDNTSAQPNTIGFAFTKVSDHDVVPGGTGPFIGILGRPKEHALVGTGSSALTPTNDLADGIVGTLIRMGILFVNLTTTTNNVDNAIFFNDVTGALGSGTAGAGETQIANAKVIIEDVPAAGLAIVEFS